MATPRPAILGWPPNSPGATPASAMLKTASTERCSAPSSSPPPLPPSGRWSGRSAERVAPQPIGLLNLITHSTRPSSATIPSPSRNATAAALKLSVKSTPDAAPIMPAPLVAAIGSSNTDLVCTTERLPRPGETLLGGGVPALHRRQGSQPSRGRCPGRSARGLGRGAGL